MRRKIRLCLASAFIALATTSATAELNPASLVKKLPALASPAKRIVPEGQLLPPAARTPIQSVRTTLTPLAGPVLKPVRTIVSTVGTPLGINPPMLSQPLLVPTLAQTDIRLNRVNSIAAPKSLPPTVGDAPFHQGPQSRKGPGFQLTDRDPAGQLITPGRILLIDPAEGILKKARAQGFSVLDDRTDAEFRFRVVTLAVPRGSNAIEAMQRLRRIAPQQTADFDHVYEPAGGTLATARTSVAKPRAGAPAMIGMVDGGVASHPSLIGRVAEQRGFAGIARATGHGTAIASLLVGSHGAFRGSSRGSSLLVADVYGGNSSAGSASRIAQALSWLASKRPRVINISLVGPPNALLKRSIDAVRAKGISVVAAVGNDGPASSPRYPASYPGVIAITGVDARGRALFESSKAIDLDFAAPGADMAAARPGNGYTRVRGTSFASALASGRLAMVGSPHKLAAEARPGKGPVGRGVVCAVCRIPPQAVGAR